MSQSDASPDLCEFAPAAYSVSTIVRVSQGLAIIRQWQYGVGEIGDLSILQDIHGQVCVSEQRNMLILQDYF